MTATTTATTTLVEIPLSQIIDHKNNPRQEIGDVTELAASIAEQGLLEPLLVAPDVDSKATTPRYIMIAGHRRRAGCKLAKLKAAHCIVRHDLDTPAKQIEAMLVENLQRVDLTPVEEAKAYQLLLEFPDYTQKRIATATGRTLATVRSRLQLTKLSDTTQDRLHRGQISLHDAAAIVEFADDPDVMADLEEALVSGRGDLTWKIERARRDRKVSKALVRLGKELEKSGVKVTTEDDLGKLWDDDNPTPPPAGLDPWYYVETRARAELGDLAVDDPAVDHATCPGHAAFLDTDYDKGAVIRYVCTAPVEHPELLDAGDPEADDGRAEREAKAAAESQLEEDLIASAKVRRRHLAEVMLGDVKNADQIAKALLTSTVMSLVDGSTYGIRRVVADMLFPDRLNDDAIVERIRDTIRKLSIPQLAILHQVISKYSSADTMLLRRSGWQPIERSYGGVDDYSVKQTAKWRELLTTMFGYQWTDPEWELLGNASRTPDEPVLPLDDERLAEDVDDAAATDDELATVG